MAIIPSKSFESTLYIPCTIAEMTTGGKLLVGSGVSLKEMTTDDKTPMFVGVNLVKDNDIGEGTVNGVSIVKKYLPSFVSQVAEAIRNPESNSKTKKLYPGHSKEYDIGYQLRPVLGAFVGGGRVGARAVGHCYIFPSAVNIREQCAKHVFPPVSLEAKVNARWNPVEKVIEVFELRSFDGVAVANDSDVGISDTAIYAVLKEMKVFNGPTRKEVIFAMPGEVKTEEVNGGGGGATQTIIAQASPINIQEMSVAELLKQRPDIVPVIQESVDAENELSASIKEMKDSIEDKTKQLKDGDGKLSEVQKEKEKLELKIQEMETVKEMETKKAEIVGELSKKYSPEIIKSIDKDLVGVSVKEMEKARDRVIERLEEFGIKSMDQSKKAGEVEVLEMSGLTELEGDDLRIMESKVPKMDKREAMLMIFESGGTEFDEKFKIFNGNIYEMRSFYRKHAEDEVRGLLNIEVKEMATRSDFPDLLEFGLDPLLIDSYFNEVQLTQFQNFFSVFNLTRNSVPFPSMKGFQIGKIVEGEEYPLVSLKPGPRTLVQAEDYGSLLNISKQMIRDGEVDTMKYSVMEIGRAHARKKDEVAAYLLSNSAGQLVGPVINEIKSIRDARIAGMEIFEADTGIKRPRFYNSLIISPARLEELVPATTTTFFQGVSIDPATGDVRGIAGMRVYVWMWIPDDFCLLVVAKDKMIQAVREGLSIDNAHSFKDNSELVRSNEAYTFAVLDADNVLKVEFS